MSSFSYIDNNVVVAQALPSIRGNMKIVYCGKWVDAFNRYPDLHFLSEQYLVTLGSAFRCPLSPPQLYLSVNSVESLYVTSCTPVADQFYYVPGIGPYWSELWWNDVTMLSSGKRKYKVSPPSLACSLPPYVHAIDKW